MTAVRSLAFVALFYLWSAAVAIGMLPTLLGPRRWSVAMMGLWGRGIMALLRVVCGIRVELRGREHMPRGAAVVAPKHQCMFDVFAQFAWLPFPFQHKATGMTESPAIAFQLLHNKTLAAKQASA